MSERSKVEHPRPPENVRIVRPDGTEIPCELRYVGDRVADDGKVMHMWEGLSEYIPQIPQDKVRVDMVPARTELSLKFIRPQGAANG